MKEKHILYLDRYLISLNNGKHYRLTNDGRKEMKVGYTGNPKYQYKTIGVNGVSRVYVHRLVWECVNGPIPKGYTIDHIDGDRYNNDINNLQLLTQSQNSRKTFIETRKTINFKKKVFIKELNKEFESVVELATWFMENNKTKSKTLKNVRIAISKTKDGNKLFGYTIERK